jgi:tRNA dimethylallyltransferase
MASDALVITGPTASGKTAVSLEVARRIGGEIISMDSRQVYRGMDIGTAKATPAERAAVPHYGLDQVDPDERYSAGRFARDARIWIADSRARDRVPILVGGTGFFLRALLQPLFREPPTDTTRRRHLDRFLTTLPPDRLAAWARALDPVRATRVHDRQRLARTVEVALLTGRPLSWWHAQPADPAPGLSLRIIVLELDRELLYERINRRVDELLARGLVEEVRDLAERYGAGAPGLNATGYIELVPYLRGERSLAEAAELIRSATRAYARRQLTWLRNQLPADVIRLNAAAPLPELAETIVAEWRRQRE